MKNNNIAKNSSNCKKAKDIIYTIFLFLGEALLVFFVFMTLYNPSAVGRFFKSVIITSTSTTCTLNGQEYNIGTDSNYNIECDNCSQEMIKDIKDNHIVYLDHEKNFDNIKTYFELNGGSCN